MTDQVSNRFLNRSAHHVQLRECRVSFLVRRAHVGLFPWYEFCVHQKSVLKAVDPQRCSLAKTHSTKMSCDFQAAFVSCINCGSEFRARDMPVALKRGNALVGPVLYRFACVLWAGEVVHLRVGC